MSPSLPLRLGVTGHRLLSHPQALTNRINECLSRLRRESRSPILLSPLAEGADRIVAHVLLNSVSPRPELDVLLPFPQPVYERTFRDASSVREFRALLSQARTVEVYSPGPHSKPEDAFLGCGITVVDRSDILIAIWDGQPAKGRGGTGDVVAYARKIQKPLAWILSEPPFFLRFENLNFPLEKK